MNITEAVRTQSLLAWLVDPDPGPQITGIAVVDARFLADRAQRVLGAGPGPHDIEQAFQRRLDTSGPGGLAVDRLVRLAKLLQPCPAPDFESGWDLCAHAEPWPCVITRAAWLAVGLDDSEAGR